MPKKHFDISGTRYCVVLSGDLALASIGDDPTDFPTGLKVAGCVYKTGMLYTYVANVLSNPLGADYENMRYLVWLVLGTPPLYGQPLVLPAGDVVAVSTPPRQWTEEEKLADYLARAADEQQ